VLCAQTFRANVLPKHVAIPRSTVSTWQSRVSRPVVTIEPVEQDHQQLVDAMVNFERQKRILAAVVRILLAMLRASGFTLAGEYVELDITALMSSLGLSIGERSALLVSPARTPITSVTSTASTYTPAIPYTQGKILRNPSVCSRRQRAVGAAIRRGVVVEVRVKALPKRVFLSHDRRAQRTGHAPTISQSAAERDTCPALPPSSW